MSLSHKLCQQHPMSTGESNEHYAARNSYVDYRSEVELLT